MTLSTDRLGSGERATSGEVTLFTVPAGERWLLRDLRVSKSGATAPVTAYAGTGSGNRPLLTRTLAADVEMSLEDAFVVLQAGDTLKVTTSGGGFYALASGHRWTL